MSRAAPLSRRTLLTLLLALLLLPAASAEDVHSQRWMPGSQVRVATAPSLRPVPASLAGSTPLPTLAHGYADLVARHARLDFVDLPYPTTTAAIAAVCHQEADLVLVLAGAMRHTLPCPDLVASGRFHGGATLLVGRTGEWLPREMHELEGRTIAVVDGGPYTVWLRAHHPATRLLYVPDRHATLAAVESGLADLAIGMEPTLRPMVRRHFNGRLRLQPFDSDFSTDLHLLARREDQLLLHRIERALQGITLEEHAGLLQTWAHQALPATVDRVLDWMRIPPPFWWLLLAPLLAALPLLSRMTRHLRNHGDQEGARAVGMLSHEMRNSTQAVLTSIELLGRASLPTGERDLLATAHVAGQSLRNLLNRALEFSRLAHGAFRPNAQPCDITLLCCEVLDAIRPQAQQKGLKLHLANPEAPSPVVLVDADGLRQIISNLLANAVKFSDIGGVELRLQFTPSTRPRNLLLEVIDSGIGIAPAQVSALFQPFQQGGGGQQRGGTGLGLAIARELARAMGGELTVHSVLGRGSRFILRLPVDPARPDACIAHTAVVGRPLTGLDLLLVEDHELNRHVIAEQLRQWGAQVCAVADAASALDEQARLPRQTLLLDIELRGIDGHALARELRRRANGPLRLIALSARTGRRHTARCRRSGFDAVLAKPLRATQLLPALGLPARQLPVANDETAQLHDAYAADIGNELAQIERMIHLADARALRHHAHRLQGALQMLGECEQATIAADLSELGHDAVPDWADVRRLLGILQERHGARAAGTMPGP